MKQAPLLTAVLLMSCIGTACVQSGHSESVSDDSLIMNQRAARLDVALAHPDSSAPDRPLAQWKMPEELKEISGLTLTSDGRLLTHGDERGHVFEVDYRRGVVVKKFSLGSPVVHGDFESITMVRDSVFLLTSTGILYRFPEGSDHAVVSYVSRDTGLGEACEFEGMAYDSTARSLLLACKHVHAKAMKDSLIIFRVAVDLGKNGKEQPVTHLAVPMARITASTAWERFEPTDITINPFNGNYVMVDSREQGVLEITPSGSVVTAKPLPPGHSQAEGIAITRDHLLIISDEARGGPALITVYRWP